MHQPMVMRAQQQQVLETGFTAGRPVPDVMGIDDDFDDNINVLPNLLNNPSAEGLLTAVKTFRNHSPPP